MTSETIKITFKTKFLKKSFFVLNTNSWMSFLESVQSNLQEVELNKLRKYWIDTDGDSIEIDNESSFKVFHLQNSQNKKIFLQDDPLSDQCSKNGRTMCDNCENEVNTGIGYKCLECENYNLCFECGGKSIHEGHVMIRWPRRDGRILRFENVLNKESPITRVKMFDDHMQSFINMMTNFHKLFSSISIPQNNQNCESFDKKSDRDQQNTVEQEPDKIKSVLEGYPTAQLEAENIKSILEEFQAQNESQTRCEAESPTTPSQRWEIIESGKPETLELISSEKDEEANILVPERIIAQPPPDFRDSRDVPVERRNHITAKPKKVRETPRIYHTNPRINDATHALMAMGFSNEGSWLTQLLVSVNGDISQALDLMRPVKP